MVLVTPVLGRVEVAHLLDGTGKINSCCYRIVVLTTQHWIVILLVHTYITGLRVRLLYACGHNCYMRTRVTILQIGDPTPINWLC